MLEGKVIVVTGGAGLLGKQFCRAIAAAGATAIVADCKLDSALAVAGELNAAGLKAQAATLDITDAVSVAALIKDLPARFGKIDAVVNNAYPRNKNYGRKVEEVTYADFCENLSLHAGGYFLVMQQFAAYFAERGEGNIVNMSSIYGSIAPRFDVYEDTPMTMPVEYAAIKASIVHMSRYFAQYYKARGVRVNCLSPGGILDRQPDAFLQRYRQYCGAKGMLDAADMTGSLVFLLSDASRYVNGQNLIVDDGFTL